MKLFFLLLLLIASGIFFAILTRPFTLLAEAARNLRQVPKPRTGKLQNSFAAAPARGRTGNGVKPSLPADRWRPATQF
jgi:hypothetical protein